MTGNLVFRADTFVVNYPRRDCPNPHDVSSEMPPPSSYNEALSVWASARNAGLRTVQVVDTLPWFTGSLWEIDEDGFCVAADISALLAVHGDGEYSIWVYALIDGESAAVSQYSIIVP